MAGIQILPSGKPVKATLGRMRATPAISSQLHSGGQTLPAMSPHTFTSITGTQEVGLIVNGLSTTPTITIAIVLAASDE